MHGNAEVGRAPLDILFVIRGLRVGGSERQLAMLASALARSGLRVAVYTFLDGPVRAQLEAGGVEVVLGPPCGVASPLAIMTTALDLFAFMRRRRPRIAHFFLPAAYLIGAPLALLAGVPIRVMSRRSLNTYQRNALVRAIEGLSHKTMHAVLGNSRGVVDELRGEGVARERLGLIYNGLDGSLAQCDGATARARLSLPAAALVMSIVANLIPYKGHADLVDALARAAPRLPAGWRLLVVGRDDGIGGSLRAQAERLGLKDNIVFMGPRDDVATVLAASDIGIICSHEEGFSNAILEGMAAGLPMVVTRVGGNTEAVLDGETGLVVPAHDSDSLAAAILRLADDAGLRGRLGAAGRTRVTDTFSVERFVEGHRALYAALQAGRHPADVPEIAVP